MLDIILLVVAIVCFLCGARDLKVWGFHLGWVGLAFLTLTFII